MEYTTERPLRLIELFAGIGSQTQALKNIGVPHTVVGISEIDKYAISTYMAMHGETHNFGDITKILALPDADMWTYSFPCQDISVAGKGAGIKEGTRSGLLYEVERLLIVANANKTLPKYLLLENVKNLVSKKFKADFDRWLDFLAALGYTNYWKILNAKDYGIPQHRERVFCVSIRGEHTPFVFPEKQELTIRLRDMIDEVVDEKYYLKESTIRSILTSTFNSRRDCIRPGDGLANCLCARDYKEPQCVQVGEVVGGKWDKMHDISRRVYEPSGLSPTVHCQQGGNTELKIMVEGHYMPSKHAASRVINPDGLAPTVMENHGTITAIAENFVLGGLQEHQVPRTDGCCPTLTEAMGKGGGQTPIIVAMRGRNPVNPSDRSPGIPLEQVIEPNEHGIANALTTVQKDNLVLEDKGDYVARCYKEFYEKKGYLPEKFVAYNRTEVGDIAPTLTGQCSSPSGSSAVLCLEQPIKVKVATQQGYEEAEVGDYVNTTYPSSTTKRGRVGKGVAHTITCGDGNAVITENVRIRKLTPRECLRLMGWRDEQIDKITVSATQQYRQAGNGIVVQVLEAIFKALFFAED